MRVVLITESLAATFPSGCDPDRLQACLRSFGWEVLMTDCPAPGEEPAPFMELCLTSDRVVIAGGDATIRHVVQHLVGTAIPLVVVPCGSTNAFAHALGIPTDPIAAIGLARTGSTRPIAAARVNGLHFLHALTLGAGPAPSEDRPHDDTPNAWLRVWRRLWRHKQMTVRVSFDGHRIRYEAFHVSVANGAISRDTVPESAGSGRQVPPLAVEIVGPKAAWPRWHPSLAPVHDQDDDGDRHVYWTDTCRIVSGDLLTVRIDGEPMTMAPPLTITVVHGVAVVMVPATPAGPGRTALEAGSTALGRSGP